MQVNVTHPLTFKLNSLINDETAFKNLLMLMYKVACVQCGYCLNDPVGFSDMVIEALLSVGESKKKVVEEEVQ